MGGLCDVKRDGYGGSKDHVNRDGLVLKGVGW